MDRLALLSEVLAQNPDDAFARYGLAMEYSKIGQTEQALVEFGKLLSTHPDYTAGYFMAAQTLSAAGRTADAKRMLSDGIASAKKSGNAHAQSEMEAMLGELSSS
jgi:tetratricopeptide (TPR) repeat protein